MQERKALSKEKPVMVLRYSAPRVALFVFIFFPFGLALFSPLFMEPSEPISTFDRYFVGYGAPIFGILVIWLILDLLNTKQIEVYKDRIVKRVRIDIPFFREKIIYFQDLYFMPQWWGLLLAKKIGWCYTRGPRFFLYTSRLSKNDERKLADFLAKVSNRDPQEFLKRPIFGVHKKLIKGGYNGPCKR